MNTQRRYSVDYRERLKNYVAQTYTEPDDTAKILSFVELFTYSEYKCLLISYLAEQVLAINEQGELHIEAGELHIEAGESLTLERMTCEKYKTEEPARKGKQKQSKYPFAKRFPGYAGIEAVTTFKDFKSYIFHALRSLHMEHEAEAQRSRLKQWYRRDDLCVDFLENLMVRCTLYELARYNFARCDDSEALLRVDTGTTWHILPRCEVAGLVLSCAKSFDRVAPKLTEGRLHAFYEVLFNETLSFKKTKGFLSAAGLSVILVCTPYLLMIAVLIAAVIITGIFSKQVWILIEQIAKLDSISILSFASLILVLLLFSANSFKDMEKSYHTMRNQKIILRGFSINFLLIFTFTALVLFVKVSSSDPQNSINDFVTLGLLIGLGFVALYLFLWPLILERLDLNYKSEVWFRIRKWGKRKNSG